MSRLPRNDLDLIPLMKTDKDLAIQSYYERHSQKVLAWRKRSIARRFIDFLAGAKPPKFIPFED